MTKSSKDGASVPQVNEALRHACSTEFGVLSSTFLCQSIGILQLKAPICVPDTVSVGEVIKLLQKNKVGAVLLTQPNGTLSGIFSERDCLLKVMGSAIDLNTTPIDTLMTKDPVSQPPDSTIAYVLNLMSQGGFRNIPIVDQDSIPIGLVSVKDLLDHIVNSYTESLLSFGEV